MGPSLSTSPLTKLSPGHRLTRVFTLVRYRFFLFAGLLPYLLGAAWAAGMTGMFDAAMFWSGLGGVVLAVVGVEAYNEYFDARMGTDRVFNPQDLPPVTDAVFWIGTAAFAGALAVGLYLTVRLGWPILAFALLGGAAAIFYEAPPIRWSYRGLGEVVIACLRPLWCSAVFICIASGIVERCSITSACAVDYGACVVNAVPISTRRWGQRKIVFGRSQARGSLYLGCTTLWWWLALGSLVAFPAVCGLPLLS